MSSPRYTREKAGSMDTEGNGLSLEGLAQRLETLERENAELRNEVTALRGSDTTRRDGPAETRSLIPRQEKPRGSEYEGRVSRRSLLSKAGAAAVAAMAAGTLMYPREAKAAEEVLASWVVAQEFVSAGTDVSAKQQVIGYGGDRSTAISSDAAVVGRNPDGPGVEGISNAFTGAGVAGQANGGLGTGVKATGGFFGVDAIGNVGVRGTGTDDQQAGVKGEGPTGVWGRTSKTHFAGVYGEHTGTSGNGVLGIGKGGEQGVFGKNPDNIGVRGDGKNGVYGESTTGNGWGAVVGRSTGRGGIGTYGECSGGTGVKGVSTSGYAGVFEGGKAQLKLKPAGSAGKPTSGTHAKGEIYMDSAGALFVCVASSTATAAAKWKKLSATAV